MTFYLTRRAALVSLGIGAALAGGGTGAALMVRRYKELQKYQDRLPSPSSSWVDRVSELHRRIDQGDFPGAAKSAGYLTNEAFGRADRVVQAWLAIRNQHRGLLPRDIAHRNLIWNYKDCAADMYCHFVIEASLVSPQHLDALRDILARERAITSGGLPCNIDLETGELLKETLDEQIFGAVEYAKDGLLPILERVGPSEWLDRMREIVDAVIAASPYETRYGRVPSEGTEKNGEFLQVLARLYHRDPRPEYLAAGRAIADVYTKEILPFGEGLPVQTWSFDGKRPIVRDLMLRDHNNEIIAGLAEWVMAESVAPGNRSEEYRAEVERMMDLLLDRGRDSSGLWLDTVMPVGHPPPSPPLRPLNDSWGYLTAGYAGYALSLPEGSARRQRYLAESARALQAVIQYRHAAWQNGKMDGYADTIEGALYLLPVVTVAGAARWVDDEMGTLLAFQQADGFVDRRYLDGNYVRTALLYALFRTQGARPVPWQPGLRLGAVTSPQGLHLAIASDAAWSGRIVFDRARYRDFLNLPFNYSRLNGWSEWFTAQSSTQYSVTRVRGGEQAEVTTVAGSNLIDGIGVDLPAGASMHLTIMARS